MKNKNSQKEHKQTAIAHGFAYDNTGRQFMFAICEKCQLKNNVYNFSIEEHDGDNYHQCKCGIKYVWYECRRCKYLNQVITK